MNIQFPSGSGIQGFVYWLLAQIMSWGWVSYAFAIVFFTIFIKLILSPLDFLNRFLTRRTQIKQQALAGELADIQKTYGNDPMAFARARQALYQKNGVGGLGSTLISLVSIILTMVIFFQVMGALSEISNYNMRLQYQELQGVYQSYKTQYPDEADFASHHDDLKAALNEKYQATNIQAGWIKNIWQPDSPLVKSTKSIEDYNKNQPEKHRLTTDEQKAEYQAIYDCLDAKDQSNGFFLLAVISAVAIFLSMKINAIMAKRNAPKKVETKKAEPIITYSLRDVKLQNNGQEQPMVDPAQMSKMMTWMMPIIYVFFATMQTSAFAIYMIASSVVSTLLSVGFAFLIDLILKRMKQPEIKKDFDATVINPHAKYFKGGRK